MAPIMAYARGDFDLALAAAAGNDPALAAELRACFLDSVLNQVALLRRSRCDGNWSLAAERLRGLGASFHSGELVRLAEEAIDGAPGDPVIIRKLCTFAESFSATD